MLIFCFCLRSQLFQFHATFSLSISFFIVFSYVFQSRDLGFASQFRKVAFCNKIESTFSNGTQEMYSFSYISSPPQKKIISSLLIKTRFKSTGTAVRSFFLLFFVNSSRSILWLNPNSARASARHGLVIQPAFDGAR